MFHVSVSCPKPRPITLALFSISQTLSPLHSPVSPSDLRTMFKVRLLTFPSDNFKYLTPSHPLGASSHFLFIHFSSWMFIRGRVLVIIFTVGWSSGTRVLLFFQSSSLAWRGVPVGKLGAVGYVGHHPWDGVNQMRNPSYSRSVLYWKSGRRVRVNWGAYWLCWVGNF